MKKAVTKKPTAKKASVKRAVTKKPIVRPQAAAKPSNGPKLESKIKNLVLEGTDGPFKLTERLGQNIVLYFYPKDNTPGCTVEGHEFSNLLSEFKNANTIVYGISRDTLKSHHGFKQKQNYAVDLLSDDKEVACSLFDVVKDKNMYGKKVRGIERSTFVIGSDGKLKKEWRKVKVEGHAQDVLNYVKELNG